jgi:acyl carrier protein
MKEHKFIKIISKILNKKITGNAKTKLSEIENIDSLEYVKIIIGLKEYSIILSINDLEKLTIHEIIETLKK